MHTFFTLGTLALSAFLFCLILTPFIRDLFLRHGLVDHPDSERKTHLRAVPRMGGIPIALAYGCALLTCFYLSPDGGGMYIQHKQLFLALLPAALLVFTTGLLDDLYGLKPWQKLCGELLGACLAVAFGAHLSIGQLPVWVCNLLSVIWLIGCSNAVNLIDGMDGLATGVGLLASLTTIVMALLTGNHGLALATVPLAGALLAFLRYNFAPASVFLGDCGSLTIGFALGCFSLIWSQHSGTVFGIVAPLMALALPLVDVGLAIGRRYLRSVPIFSADRGHIHHKVLGLGFSTRGAALLLYAVCGLSASLAVLEDMTPWSLGWLILLVFLTLVLLGINKLGYIEFAAAARTLSRRSVLRAVQDDIYVQELSASLNNAQSLEAWWTVIHQACREMRFSSARLEFEGRVFSHHFIDSKEKPSCRIQLGFGDSGQLLLMRVREQDTPRNMMAVVNCLQLSFEDRLGLYAAEVSPAHVRAGERLLQAEPVRASSAA